jgi:CheY-like chemotaxis protein
LRVWVKKQGVRYQDDAQSLHYALLRFEIEDTGIGLSPSQLERIFLPFEQVGDIRRRADGAGLGLAITKNLVEAMGGALAVESTLHQGSIFRVDLEFPVLEPVKQLQKSPVRDVVGYQGKTRRILVVDDEPHNRAMLIDLLAPLGFDVTAVESGKKSVETLPNLRPDAILMDLIMPEMSGLETVKTIRQFEEPGNVRTVIIAASASVSEDVQLESKQVGCDDFLAKPIAIERLLELLEAHLGLQWTYNEAADGVSSAAYERSTMEETNIIPPPPQELAILFDLAMKGDLSSLHKRAVRLKQTDEEFKPFAEKLCQLVDEVNEDQLLVLLQGHMES